MRFGVHLVAAGKMIEGESIARVARRAEELGYDSLWVSDHIIFPAQLQSASRTVQIPRVRPSR